MPPRPQTLNGDVLGDIRLANSRTYFTILARGSGISTLNFYGFGNNTPETEPASFYRVRQNQFTLEPARHLRPESAHHPDAGGEGALLRDEATTRTASSEPRRCWAPATSARSVRRAVRLDREGTARDDGDRRRRHGRRGSVYAPVWSVPSTFGEVHAAVNWSWNLHPRGLKPTLGFRVGGERVWGDYPFMNAAFIGGGATVRSLRYNRYAGDASLYGGAELRLRLARISALLASDLGVMGLVDVGRVFVAGSHPIPGIPPMAAASGSPS